MNGAEAVPDDATSPDNDGARPQGDEPCGRIEQRVVRALTAQHERDGHGRSIRVGLLQRATIQQVSHRTNCARPTPIAVGVTPHTPYLAVAATQQVRSLQVRSLYVGVDSTWRSSEGHSCGSVGC